MNNKTFKIVIFMSIIIISFLFFLNVKYVYDEHNKEINLEEELEILDKENADIVGDKIEELEIDNNVLVIDGDRLSDEEYQKYIDDFNSRTSKGEVLIYPNHYMLELSESKIKSIRSEIMLYVSSFQFKEAYVVADDTMNTYNCNNDTEFIDFLNNAKLLTYVDDSDYFGDSVKSLRNIDNIEMLIYIFASFDVYEEYDAILNKNGHIIPAINNISINSIEEVNPIKVGLNDFYYDYLNYKAYIANVNFGNYNYDLHYIINTDSGYSDIFNSICTNDEYVGSYTSLK